MAARAKKNFLAKRYADAISARVHYRDLEHASVYWIWLRDYNTVLYYIHIKID